jgi:hypothetical protein
MGIFDGILIKSEPHNPEDDFVVTITDTFVRVEHPQRKTEQVLWENIEQIKLFNTDQGPWLPDVWLGLMGKEDGCLIPHGAKGFDAVFDIVSKYEGFNLDNFIESMSCTDNAEFLLWTKP